MNNIITKEFYENIVNILNQTKGDEVIDNVLRDIHEKFSKGTLLKSRKYECMDFSSSVNFHDIKYCIQNNCIDIFDYDDEDQPEVLYKTIFI